MRDTKGLGTLSMTLSSMTPATADIKASVILTDAGNIITAIGDISRRVFAKRPATNGKSLLIATTATAAIPTAISQKDGYGESIWKLTQPARNSMK